MPDHGAPQLNTFKLSREEKIATRWALAKADPWAADKIKRSLLSEKEKGYVDAIVALKVRIRDFHLERQFNCCCYCAFELKGRPLEQDREHIIPKSKIKELSFSIFNLAVACKTCNMTMKSSGTHHLRRFRRSGLANPGKILSEENYNIVHPNIHDWDEHILLDVVRTSRKNKVIHYSAMTKRGAFTYYYFKLHEHEVFQNIEEQRRIRAAQPLHPKLIEIRKKFGQ